MVDCNHINIMFDFAIVKVDAFQGEKKADRHGMQNVILSPVAGKIPSKRVLAGTLADRAGFEIGTVHMVSIQELPSNEYGRQFQFTSLGVVSPGLELLKACKEVGQPFIVDVNGTTPVAEQEIVLQNATPVAEPVM